ncbi:uncharacterized protein LOC108744392 isoform X1 [Agrilus planipennis]|uniref:Uncharacterized protein LOC108744392 isoform X1 n=1 Tax=Agrilus planipennis TaxID=224129 RepID=A0A1W4XS63_AGRPL|nr:uncharacterized protein LOC108744392 isoform X1 [Agrilus planipennis]
MDFIINKKRRQTFTFEEKLKVIREIEKGKKQSQICRERNMPSSTVSSLWKNRKILFKAIKRKNINSKKNRKPVYDDVDEALYKWYVEQKAKGIIVTSRFLRTKAEEIGVKLRGSDCFYLSYSWIDRFKKRHSIRHDSEQGTLVNTEDKNETIGLEDFENRNEDVVISGSSEKHNDDHNLDNIERVVVQVKNETEVSNTFYTEMVKSEDNGKKTKSMEGNGTSKGFADGLGNVRIKEENEEEGADIILPEIVTLEDENQPKRSTKEATITKPSETNDDDDLLFFKSLLPDLRSLSRERKLYIRNKIQLLILNEVYGYRIENT